MTVPKLVVVQNALFLVVLMTVYHADAANLNLAWDPSPSHVMGYKLYYGKIKRAYDMVVDVGDRTSFTLSGLESGQRYYVSVTAYDSRGNESVFGNEISAIPLSSHAGPPVMQTPPHPSADGRQATAGPPAFEDRSGQRSAESKKGARPAGESNVSTTVALRPGGDSPAVVAHGSTRSEVSHAPTPLRSATQELVSEWIEVGQMDVDSAWKRVQLRKSFVDPIVVAGALSTWQAQPAVVQLRHIDPMGFEMRLRPWDDRSSRPTSETVGYLVIERGSYILGNGSRVEAGSVEAASPHGVPRIRFEERFSTVPVVLTSVVSGHEAEVVSARPTMVHQGGFQYRLQATSSMHQSMDVPVSLVYVAWEPSWGAIDGLTLEVK